MGHVYSGFRPSERSNIQDGVSEAQTALRRALTAVTQMRSNQTADQYYQTWFGDYDKARVQHVYEAINAMEFGINSSSVMIKRTQSNNEFAAALEPDGGWSLMNVKDIIASNGFELEIANPYYQAIARREGGDHPHAQVIVHELSHIVANTDDVEHPVFKDECYGMLLSKNIAQNYPDLAIRNADNYGFFCTCYL